MSKIRIGVIGVGHLGKHHARILGEIARETGDVELTAVVDVLPDRAAEIAAPSGARAFTDFHQLYGKVDAVCLAVPTTDHARLGIELLDHGIDVLVEKPMTSTVDEAKALIAAADSHRVVETVARALRLSGPRAGSPARSLRRSQ